MVKKITLIFLALLIFLNPIIHNQAHAAVASKVVNQSAKKIAKEIIKDSAVDMSVNMIVNYKFTSDVPDLKPKEGFTMICMPKDKKPDNTCSAPLQVKTNIDKAELSARVESNLEKKIAGGIPATKWGKFVDWLIPVFSIGLGYAVIESSLSGEITSLFDEIAFESLTESGDLTSMSLSAKGTLASMTRYTAFYQKRGDFEDTGYFKLGYNGVGNDFKSTTGDVIRDLSSITLNKYTLVASGPYNSVTIPNVITSYDFNSTTNIMSLDSGKIANIERLFNLYFTPTKAQTVQPLPKYPELNLPPSRVPNQTRTIIAPGALPMEETTTKQPVYPSRQPDGTVIYKDKQGNSISENNITVKDPVTTPHSNGSTTVEKAPTVENPSPKPSENGVIPPNPDNPNNPPLEGEFPEGDTCTDKIKLPKLGALFRTMSDTFPFSIPWDLKSGFDAIFSGMDDKKPEFKYNLKFKGESYKFGFTMPDVFDSFLPFVHSILLFTFDVGILLLIHRLIKGGG